MNTPERPDGKVLLVWRVSNHLGYAIFTFIVVIVLLAILFFARGTTPAILGLLVIPLGLWLLTHIALEKQYQAWAFQVRPEALEMAHGWIWKSRRVVARDRIQHVDINSGPFDRRFGLVQVVVYTAGTTVGMIPGLSPERANLLREQLLAGRAVE